MFSYIHSTTVVVADQQAALDFYVDVLGFEKTADMPMGEGVRWLTVSPAGAKTQLALAPTAWFSEGNTLRKSTGISIVTADIEATYAALVERGVKFKDGPTLMPWGSKAAWMFDVDGNELFVVEQ